MAGKQIPVQMVMTAEDKGVSAGIKKVHDSLSSLGATAKKASDDTATGLSGIGDAGEKTSVKIDRATRSIANSLQRQLASIQGGGATTAKSFELLAGAKGANTDFLRPLIQQLKEAEAAQAKLNGTAQQGAPALQNMALSGKALNAAMRQVPAQVTDIVTGLQAGQAPLTVLLQQGGQLKDVFGGVGPAVKALSTYLLSLVNPFSLAAAAAAVLGYAYFQGAKEAQAFNKALILSGNATGTTVSQLTEMAKAIAKVSGTQGAAAEALTKFAGTGDVAAQNLERFTLAAIRFEKAGGDAVDETVKKFTELRRDPLEASVKLNESLRYLTLTTYGQIKALQEQGREADAATAAQNAFGDAMASRTKALEANLGAVQVAWQSVSGAAKKAWDNFLGIGRETTLAERLQQSQARLESLRNRSAAGGRRQSTTDQEIAQEKEAYLLLSKQLGLQNDVAASAKTAADQVAARVKFDKDGLQFLTNEQKILKEIRIAREQGLAAGASQEEIDKRIANIREKFGKEGENKARELDKAKLALDIETIRAANAQLVDSYSSAEKILEAQRSAGLLGDREYYEAKRAFIRLNSEAEQQELQKELARLQQEKLSGKDKLDNDKKIAEAQKKLAEVDPKSAAELEKLAVQQQASGAKLVDSYAAARQAAKEYLQTLQLQQKRQTDGAALGDKARQEQEGLFQILDKYAEQRRRLENERERASATGTLTDERKKQLDDELALTEQFQQKAVDSYSGYYAIWKAKEADWSVGTTRALNNFLESTQAVASQTQKIFTGVFDGLADAIATFVATGKTDFKSLATSIIADLARMQARAATSQLFQYLASAFAGYSSVPAGAGTSPGDPSLGGAYPRALGGPVSAGGMYRVNERGPELLSVGGNDYLMMGRQGGAVTPNAGGAPQVVNNYNVAAGVQRSELTSALQKQDAIFRATLEQRLRAVGA